jgi:hypothetical protein
MNTKILVEKRVYSNLVKFVIETRKLLLDISERPEFAKEWLSVKDLETEFGITRKVFEGYRKNGLKVIQKKQNGGIKIRRCELEKFLTKK